jgi:porphobilinogen deaminase
MTERVGYVRRGLKDRVTQVDKEIKRLGGKADEALQEVSEAVEETAALVNKVETAVLRKSTKKK